MTKTLPPRAILFGVVAADAREALATTLFDPETVFAAMANAAAKGDTIFTITPQEPYDLQNTAAAIRLCDALKTERFKVSWAPINNPLDTEEPPFFSLVIRWHLKR